MESFESSIGECEEILGDIATQIDQIAVDSSLTEEERRIKLEQMADNEVRKIQEMDRLEEEEKEFFGFDLSEYTTTQEIHNAENPWLNQKGLQIMIEQYLNARLGQGTYILGEGDVKQLRLSANARLALREDFRSFLPEEMQFVRHGIFILRVRLRYIQLPLILMRLRRIEMLSLLQQCIRWQDRRQSIMSQMKRRISDCSMQMMIFR